MLLLSNKLKDSAVMSLQTGTQIAQLLSPVIDPASLTIVAYRIKADNKKIKNILLTEDIREIGTIGCIVDSSDELVSELDMVKLKPLLELDFKLLDKQVVDENNVKLGKVYEYTLDPMQFKIYQLYIKRPLMKSLQNGQLIINRSQITEVNNTHIVVKSATLSNGEVSEIPQSFVNPFRKSSTPPQSANIAKE